MIARIRNTTLRRIALVVSAPVLIPFCFALCAAEGAVIFARSFTVEMTEALRQVWRKR
jgi:hypothetical protein